MTHTAPGAGEPLEQPNVLHPQAAAELAQELALVSNALFAQLFPSTPMRAIAGVAGVAGTVEGLPGIADDVTQQLDHAAPGHHAATVAPATVAGPGAPAAATAAAAAPTPEARPSVAVPTPAAASGAPVAVPVPGVQVPTAPLPAVQVPEPATPATEAPTVAAVPLAVPLPVPTPQPDDARAGGEEAPRAVPQPARPDHLSLAMLEEIGFLDE